MKIKRTISTLLANWLVILGLAFLVIKILDWYNPLMNFSGQTEILQIMLGICAVVSGVFHIFTDRPKKKTSDTAELKSQ